MTSPLLSVVMPTYNGERWLGEALESVRAQRDPGIEVIAIDDGSTDRTLDILHAYARLMPLRIVARRHGGNWVANTAHGMRLARGGYICWLHQDDLWSPGRMAAVRRALEGFPRTALLLHWAWYVDAAGRRMGRFTCPLPQSERLLAAEVAQQRLLVQCSVACCAPIFSREAIEEVGLPDERLWYSADWDYWLRLAALGRTVHLPRPYCSFRLHAGSQTMRAALEPAELERQQQEVLARHLWSRPENMAIRGLAAAAELSAELNVALAQWMGGRGRIGRSMIVRLMRLGPAGAARFLHETRLWERIAGRARAGLIGGRRHRAAQAPASRALRAAVESSA